MVNKKKGDVKELRERAKKKKSDDQNKGEVAVSMIIFRSMIRPSSLMMFNFDIFARISIVI